MVEGWIAHTAGGVVNPRGHDVPIRHALQFAIPPPTDEHLLCREPGKLHMIPRGVLDIGWSDLLWGLACAVGSPSARQVHPHELVCLSARSGFDLLLQDLDLSPGDEIVMSAVTIPDMVKIVAAHGLVAVPVDVEIDTLMPTPHGIESAIGPRTRAIVIAQLMGGRAPLAPYREIAMRNNTLLVEDCAQAFDSADYRGDSSADVSLMSFGPIKTATATAGGVVVSRDLALIGRLRDRLRQQPVQTRAALVRRILRIGLLKSLCQPHVFGLFVTMVGRLGRRYDDLLAAATRGFPPDQLLTRLRVQPSVALERLVRRRMSQSHHQRIAARQRYAQQLLGRLPQDIAPGARQPHRTHWVLPIISRSPDALVRYLQENGFDATRRGSSMYAVPSPTGSTTPNATRLIESLVYLPSFPSMSKGDIDRLASLVRRFEGAAGVDPCGCSIAYASRSKGLSR
jgi:perosamine synthetase